MYRIYGAHTNIQSDTNLFWAWTAFHARFLPRKKVKIPRNKYRRSRLIVFFTFFTNPWCSTEVERNLFWISPDYRCSISFHQPEWRLGPRLFLLRIVRKIRYFYKARYFDAVRSLTIGCLKREVSSLPCEILRTCQNLTPRFVFLLGLSAFRRRLL